MKNCLCGLIKNYTCYDCELKAKARNLNILQRAKLLRYEKFITEGFTEENEKEFNDLMIYMIDNNLDSGMIDYIK